MRNKVILVSEEDVIDYVYWLFEKDSPLRSSDYVENVIRQFAQLPRIFFDASDRNIEWTHFSTWWGAIMHASYDNPNIRDLRYLHEVFHGATFPYVQGLTFEQMFSRNMANEKAASVFTEMAIYLDVPEMRERSFDHPILMDRVVTDYDHLTTMWKQSPDRTIQELIFIRDRFRVADSGPASDPQTLWVKRYDQQNLKWGQVWKERHDMIDDAMLLLRNRSQTDRKGAIEQHLEFLDSVSTDGIPFYDEAVVFRKIFDNLLTDYNNAMIANGHQPVVGR